MKFCHDERGVLLVDGVEYMHIPNIEERSWIQEHMEGVDFRNEFSVEFKKKIYKDWWKRRVLKTICKSNTGTKRFQPRRGRKHDSC